MSEKMWDFDPGEPRIPIKKALLKIFLFTLLVSGSIAFCLLLYFHLKELQTHDPLYSMIEIQQSGPDKEIISSQYLANILGLSLATPYPLSQLDMKEAKKKLLAHPLIKTVEIKKMMPKTLSIDYTLRRPVAIFTDTSPQTAMDCEGYLIPLTPFFSPKNLPKISIGNLNGHTEWGKVIHPVDRLQLLLSLLHQLKNNNLQSLDISKINASSVGQREIVVTLQDQCVRETNGTFSQLCLCPRILRLHPENYRQQLANYQVLRKHLLEQEKQKEPMGSEDVITLPTKKIDLRISKLAFFQQTESK